MDVYMYIHTCMCIKRHTHIYTYNHKFASHLVSQSRLVFQRVYFHCSIFRYTGQNIVTVNLGKRNVNSSDKMSKAIQLTSTGQRPALLHLYCEVDTSSVGYLTHLSSPLPQHHQVDNLYMYSVHIHVRTHDMWIVIHSLAKHMHKTCTYNVFL